MRCARTQPVVAVFLASALLLVEAQRMRGSFGDAQDMRGEHGVPEGGSKHDQIEEFQHEASQQVEEATYASKEKLGEVATVIGKKLTSKLSSKKTGKSLALGCTALLKAQNDGKMQWFESQQWYEKALETCISLSPTDDKLIPEKGQFGHTFGSLKRHTAIDLLKTSCKKLSEIPAENPVRQKKWFPNAESMCSTVQSSTPEDLKALLHRQQRQAETASGQLLKKTCQEVGSSAATADDPPVQHWYRVITAVCSKLGTQKVKRGSLEKRCKRLQEFKATGNAHELSLFTLKRLDKVCSWLAGRASGGSFKDSVKFHRDAAYGAPVVV